MTNNFFSAEHLREDNQQKEYKLPLDIIIVPVRDLVVFPSMIISVHVKDSKLIKDLEISYKKGELIGLCTQKKSSSSIDDYKNIYEIGTSASILQIINISSKNEAMLLVEGIGRFKINDFTQKKHYIKANIENIKRYDNVDINLQINAQEIKEKISMIAKNTKKAPPEILAGIEKINEFEDILDLASSFLTLSVNKKQELLSIIEPEKRVKVIIDYLNKELNLFKIREKIHFDVKKELNKNEKNFLLRQELKAIKKELGEDDEAFGLSGMIDKEDISSLKKRIDESKMPQSVKKIAEEEFNRLKKILPISPEYTTSRTYIEWLCDMPWQKSSKTKADIKIARKILNEDHFGLDKVKERILEFLSVCQLNKNSNVTILCFVGPPGVGKTSLGQSIAKALGRSFIHTSLGGVRDEADIRGHRKTYVGSMPGRIIQSIKRAGFNNPVFMLDEIDKINRDFHGDPSAGLMEVLDPEQNHSFTDHYLNIPFDLSKVFFITTANLLDPIPPALLNRMEIIEIPGYTEEEKVQIAKKYLIPKQLNNNGLSNKKISFTDESISKLIRGFTKEAGLRELDRQIASICRKIAKRLIENKKITSKRINSKLINQYLGVDKYDFGSAQDNDSVGVANGLAWTQSGGDILLVESIKMPGTGKLIMTGNLGGVMKESVIAGLSYIKSNATKFSINKDIFKKNDIHVHVPEGSVPKDGPSAGITICTAIVSLLTKRKIRCDVAMTGEVTLTGKVLPVGGLKEKILGAKRSNIKTVILPYKNKKNISEISPEILKNINLKFVYTLEDVFKIALLPKKKINRNKNTNNKTSTKSSNIKINKKIATIKIIPISSVSKGVKGASKGASNGASGAKGSTTSTTA